jgi:hypothetical protein
MCPPKNKVDRLHRLEHQHLDAAAGIEGLKRSMPHERSMNDELSDAVIVLLVARIDSALSGARLVEWATAALEQGLDTPALVWLAGLPPSCSVWEASPLLDRALEELGVTPLPDAADLRRAYVGAMSRQLLAERVSAGVALERIHQFAVSPLNHPPDLTSWCFAWEGLDDSREYRSMTKSESADRARELATVWAAAKHWPSPPDAHG